MKKQILFLAAGAAIVAASACTSGGSSSRAPDEFRVVTKAPLTVPPEYNLRPPAAGSSLPPELEVTSSQSTAAFGTALGQNASTSERALVASAQANAVDPVIRTRVDYEETQTIRKSKTIADRILFWRKDDAELAAGVASDSATGGGEIVIEQANASPRLKLPGT